MECHPLRAWRMLRMRRKTGSGSGYGEELGQSAPPWKLLSERFVLESL
jgi:hypothetical protein